MKKIFSLILLFCVILLISSNVFAADLDRITNYVITVDPRMNDGTLDITYEITWKVLDSTSEGPLSWVKIGTPNENFDNPTALTSNIKKIKQDNGAYVRIDFKKDYKAGEELTFKYSIHQCNMHTTSGNNVAYKFTPAWFTDARVDKMTIRWNADSVIENDSTAKEDNYLIWEKSDLSKGEKLTAIIKYEENSFSGLKTYTNVSNNSYKQTNGDEFINNLAIWGVIIIIVVTILVCITGGGGGGYYGHSGFYGGTRYHSSCVRSCACACACARSCACACAGSGRAGCSKKDFYGTKLSMKKLEKIIKNNDKSYSKTNDKNNIIS